MGRLLCRPTFQLLQLDSLMKIAKEIPLIKKLGDLTRSTLLIANLFMDIYWRATDSKKPTAATDHEPILRCVVGWAPIFLSHIV